MQTNQAYLGGRLNISLNQVSGVDKLDFVSADLGDSTNSDSQWLTVVSIDCNCFFGCVSGNKK